VHVDHRRGETRDQRMDVAGGAILLHAGAGLRRRVRGEPDHDDAYALIKIRAAELAVLADLDACVSRLAS
jgi:hypothetical protein